MATRRTSATKRKATKPVKATKPSAKKPSKATIAAARRADRLIREEVARQRVRLAHEAAKKEKRKAAARKAAETRARRTGRKATAKQIRGLEAIAEILGTDDPELENAPSDYNFPGSKGEIVGGIARWHVSATYRFPFTTDYEELMGLLMSVEADDSIERDIGPQTSTRIVIHYDDTAFTVAHVAAYEYAISKAIQACDPDAKLPRNYFFAVIHAIEIFIGAPMLEYRQRGD